MKLLYILFVLGCFTSCHSQNEKKSDFMKSLGNGYYAIPNKLDNKLILLNYQNYKNSNDTIFLEKIHYKSETDNFFLVIGNVMGSKTSLVLTLKKSTGKPYEVYAEQISLIDTVKKEKMKNFTFFLLNSHYSDMCSGREVLSIYVLNNLKLYKSFEGYRKEEFYDINNPLCLPLIPYTQKFKLKLNGTEVFLIAEKRSSDKKKNEVKKYRFRNYIFK